MIESDQLLFASRIHFPLKFLVNVQLGYGQSDLFIGRDSRLVSFLSRSSRIGRDRAHSLPETFRRSRRPTSLTYSEDFDQAGETLPRAGRCPRSLHLAESSVRDGSIRENDVVTCSFTESSAKLFSYE